MSILKSELVDLNKQIEEKGKALDELFSKAKNAEGQYDAKQAGMNGVEFAEKVRSMNDELTDLGKKRDTVAAAVQAEADHKRRNESKGAATFQHPQGGQQMDRQIEQKSFGRLFIESKSYTERINGGIGPETHLDIELKTLMQRAAGFAPESLRTGRVVEIATRPIQFIDILPLETTQFDHVKYMEETTLTNNAAEASEGTTFGEAVLAYTERSKTVEKLPVFLPVSDEQLEDVPRIETMIDNRLRFMILQRLDYQIYNGDGATPNMQGLATLPNIQTQARGADPGPDALYKAMQLVRVTGRANPSAILMHPDNWTAIRLLRTTEGIYIWGSPADAGPERIWGLPVAQGDSVASGTSVVGDFANFSAFVSKRGIDVQIGYSGNDFTMGRRSIRADLRGCLVWYRPTAFCLVTGMPT